MTEPIPGPDNGLGKGAHQKPVEPSRPAQRGESGNARTVESAGAGDHVGNRVDASDAAGTLGVNGSSRPFGVGQPDGVLPGDHRSADEVEAGIVALWRQFGSSRERAQRDRLMLHYA